MEVKEKKVLKIIYAVFFGVMALLNITIGSIYGNRSVNAGSINSDFTIPGVNNAFDDCTTPAFIRDPEVDMEDWLEV